MKIKYILVILSLAMGLASCTKELDLYPKDQVSDGSFWNSPKDFELAANAFYGTFPSHFSHNDNNAETTFGSGPDAVSNGTYVAPDNSGHWDNSYARIRGINYLLLKSETYENPEEIKTYVGEAYFFRAWQYAGLLTEFGGVPVITKVLEVDSEELNAPRNSREEVADLIIQDLQKAIEMLPNASDIASRDLGRISKGAAQAFLSRIALFEGTWAKYHNGAQANERLTIAVEAAKAVMDSGEYGLFDDFGTEDSYRKLFVEAGEDSKEVILSRRYVKDINGTHNHTRWLEQNIMNPTRSLVDDYLCTDGLPISDSPLFQGYDTMTSEFEDRDPRMAQTVFKVGTEYAFYDGTKIFEKPSLVSPVTRTGYSVYKYLAESVESWSGNSVYDNILIRYGEVLLNYAEAKYELEGSISDADLDLSINLLRDRVGMLHLTNAFVSLNGLDMKNEIRRERKIELACEGFRFNDLMRWKTAEVEMPKAIKGIKFVGTEYETVFPDLSPGVHFQVDGEGFIVAEPAANRSFDATKHYLRPLPKKQINLNPSLEQNPNW
ncbi:RagB/SusD family nutrient uptake outer membrane protein [Arenibacter sp. 6A1]|uniref:RagB/SusD family nutrient uptake outer membrane protein n=1 Tax=Arenibacter sp. 6A1 TaxID=2720391 RepID=UPI0014476ECE|nr:RagB/SusD family nutrient uptake outer membrane protein [Arenibacter sp. 6A1]NKI27500.1 RagB/SusD family nutrient uptake outer membrane protein [Arenibacter sp. 6A1]